ncbi:MAG: SDR family NAD(P)-dependent oxidoreductase [Ilumatobacteraceae bacterium]
MKLKDRVAFVTGAGRGQGRSHCLAMAREGATIFAVDICSSIESIYPLATADDLQQTVEEVEALGGRVATMICDVRDNNAVKCAVDLAIQEFGKIDILCNNAGICKVDAIDEMSSQVLEAILDVNVKGIFYTTKYIVPGMKERRYGKIINTASSGGLKALPYVSHYAASKGAVIMATKSWANELADWGINVNAICPGTILSGMIIGLAGQMEGDVDPVEAFAQFTANNMFKGERGHVAVDDISAMVVFLASEDARMITGQAIPIDAGWTSS